MNARTADAVVIGAGIAGCATAYYLSKKGLNVVVVDKGEVGDEQSSRAWGFVRQQARTARELPLMIAGAIVWQEMERELGADVEWNQGGSLTLAGDEEILGRIRAWLKVGEQFGIETRFLTNEDLKELLPAMRGEWLGAMYTPSDGHAQPNKATNAIAIGAREHGALFRTMEAVEGIEVTDGQVSAVVTERDRIVTKNVVCAAGAWSHKVAHMVGQTLPYRMVRASVGQTNPTDHITDMAVIGPRIAFRQRPTGEVYIAPGPGGTDYDVDLDSFKHIRLFMPNFRRNREMFRLHVGSALIKDILRSLPGSPSRRHPFAHTVGVEPEPNRKVIDKALITFKSMFPDLQDLKINHYWSGRIDATPDALPVIGEADSPKGFYFCTGFSGRGIGIGPIAGKVTAELIADGESSVDIHALRHSRFKDGDMDMIKAVV